MLPFANIHYLKPLKRAYILLYLEEVLKHIFCSRIKLTVI